MSPAVQPTSAARAAGEAAPGTIVLFVRLTLAGVLRRTLHARRGRKLATLASGLKGWLGNWLIALLQLRSNPGAWRDRKWELVHAGIVARRHMLAEATSPHGVRVVPLRACLAEYTQALLVPLRPPPAIDDHERLNAWLREQEGMRYNYAGLLGVLLNLGITSPDGWFCSQLCAGAYQHINLLPKRGTYLRRGKPAATRWPAGWWSPSELAREDGLLDWDSVTYVEGTP
jgi:hypothetical protein